MNRKESQEQNDTSIIIGNLPKRLQRKFAKSCLDNTENGFGQPSVSRSNVAQNDFNDKRVSVVFASSLKSDSKSTVDTIGDYQQRYCLKQKNSNDDLKKVCSALPGVLRLNGLAIDMAEEDEKPRSTDSKRKSPIHSQDFLTRDILPVSPARLPLKQSSQPNWFRNLDDIPVAKDLPQLYESLMSILRRNSLLVEWDYFCDIHQDLLSIFTEMLLQHLKFVCEQKVDTFFWKILFYNIREYLKVQQSSEATEVIFSLIENGQSFYKNLHDVLCKKYLKSSTISSSGEATRKYEFLAKVAVQKIFICLGDLSRYRIKHLQMTDYSEAFKYYQEAQRLIPSNAIPYNQLAIVSLHARKQFDAVYFHMRSLMSSNPISSAKESLLVLFDEIRKKYEESESKNTSNSTNRNPKEKKRKNSYSLAMRKEVWVYPDGARLLHRTDVKDDQDSFSRDEEELKDLSEEDLMKRFVSIYLYIVGKLYSGVGIESIASYQGKLFVCLSLILESHPMLIKRNRLLKIVALNIFLVDHNMSKESRREIRYRAFVFATQFFGIILKKCNALLDRNVVNIENIKENKFYDLNSLLQFIRIFMKWLLQTIDIWEPVRSHEHIFIDCWEELNIFLIKVEDILKTLSEAEANEEPVVFEEDNFLLGFTPIAIAYNKYDSIQKPSAETLQFVERLGQISDFQDFFKENEHLLANSCQPYISEANGSFETFSDSEETISSDEDFLKNCENEEFNGLMVKSTKTKKSQNDQMEELAKLKKELEAKTNLRKNYNAKLQEILNYVDLKLQIEVRPKYLLPDTNCFIDFLSDFEKLLSDYKYFILIVPLTVVKELEGLSKGVRVDESDSHYRQRRIHHYDDVSTNARKSLDFIRNSKNVKFSTTKGSIINASLFGLVEEEYASNDDKILATALSLSKTMSSEIRNDGKCLIRTELVLITTDRNLRVKALSRNLAVSELSEFLQWAKECKKSHIT